MAKFMKKHSAAIVLLVNIILLVVLMLWLQNSIKAASSL